MITSGGREDRYDTALGLNATYASFTAFSELQLQHTANCNLN